MLETYLRIFIASTNGSHRSYPRGVPPRLVLGVDAGGTSTRALLAAADGTRLGTGTGGGANQRSSSGSPVSGLARALAGALAGRDPREVAVAVVGIAGSAAAGHGRAQQVLDEACRQVRLTAPALLVTDIAIAHAGGSSATNGTVLLSGTGAVAAAVAAGQVTARSDGYGWLLGDTGSAVWLGLTAVRRALAALDGRAPATALLAAVVHDLAPHHDGDVGQALVAVADTLRPAELGRLAPLVGRVAEAGDAVASDLVAEAADALLASLDAVRRAARDEGVPVIGGSVLTTGGPVARLVSRGIVDRCGRSPAVVHDAAAGAAVLALMHLTGTHVADEVHRRLTAR